MSCVLASATVSVGVLEAALAAYVILELLVGGAVPKLVLGALALLALVIIGAGALLQYMLDECRAEDP